MDVTVASAKTMASAVMKVFMAGLRGIRRACLFSNNVFCRDASGDERQPSHEGKVLLALINLHTEAQRMSLRLCWVCWRLGLSADTPIVFSFEVSAFLVPSASTSP